ncbi:iron ABC transporter substrate-binding protein (plasmid) [Fulvitalea axinellae]|uniref:Iron ABC transporter substrate-binding protein n=1 Tax=Fulvitalea axinellae TaxID=1182444 RepID=A0AAU9CWD8_9BACT|nr:iron ABC transporter substrate-binding protein [Fulvitalea axinellae]
MMDRLVFGRIAVVLFLALAACSPKKKNEGKTEDIKTETATAGDSLSVRYAKRFELGAHKGCVRLTITAGDGQDVVSKSYLLVNRGEKAPVHPADWTLVNVPVRSVVTQSSEYIGGANILGDVGRIKGVSLPKYVYSEAIHKKIEAGEVLAVGEGTSTDMEKILAMKSDLLWVSGMPGSGNSSFGVLEQSGTVIMYGMNWMETDALGSAEWIKVIGALNGKLAEASKYFDKVSEKYAEVKRKVSQSDKKPVTIAGLPFKGTWYMPAGQSFRAKMFADAGFSYPWASKPGTGSLPLDIETVFPKALTATYWLNVGSMTDLKTLKGLDSRYAEFGPVTLGNVYNNNARTNRVGANDFWESGTFRPDVVLEDLATISHPDLFPAHKLYYYRKLK